MESVTVKTTLKNELCVSCGVCVGVCPVQCITMELSEEGDAYRPVIDEEKCIKCGKCKRVCPGLGWKVFESNAATQAKDLKLKGKVIGAYTTYVKNPGMLKQCVSGGTTTAIVRTLLSQKVYDVAFLVDSYDISKPLVAVKQSAGFDYEKTAGSRYAPVSQEESVRYIRNNREKKVIFVGTACSLNGILKVIEEEHLNREQYLLLGLFCDKTLNRHMFTYFESIADGKIVELHYRSKKEKDWPGNVRLVLSDGREQYMPAKKRMEVKEYMQLNRCLYCYDKLNESCDIALGDNYTKKDAYAGGSNSVIVRTQRGKSALSRCRSNLEIIPAQYRDIYQAQNMEIRKMQLEFAHILQNETGINIYPEWKENLMPVSKEAEKKYKERRTMLKSGADFGNHPDAFFDCKKQFETQYQKMQNRNRMMGKVKKIGKVAKIPKKIRDLMSALGKMNQDKPNKKYVLVTGGEWNNKGAQAMLFVTMTELSKKLPDYELCAVVPQYLIDRDRTWENFKFKVISDVVCREPAYFTLGGKWLFEALKRREGIFNMLYTHKIWKNTAYVFDVSGYAIGKKWGHDKSKRCAMLGAIARKVGAKCYYLPQSFGPFDFGLSQKDALKHKKIMKSWLSQADLLCARERVGKEMLEQEYGLTNVVYLQDIVLQNKEYSLDSIYKKRPALKKLNVLPKSVALIPNKHLTKMKKNDCYAIWENTIQYLLDKKYHVYLMVHSGDDLDVIRTLKSKFKNERNVILVEDDLSCIEYDLAVSKFDFLIASRYHSIVHAFRRETPCIVLGWADKYQVLLEDMEQLQYNFDMRNAVSIEAIHSAIDDMEKMHSENVSKIKNAVKQIQKETVFDKIF